MRGGIGNSDMSRCAQVVGNIEVVVVGGGAGRAECGAGCRNDAGMFGGGSLCCGKISKDVVAQGKNRSTRCRNLKTSTGDIGRCSPVDAHCVIVYFVCLGGAAAGASDVQSFDGSGSNCATGITR